MNELPVYERFHSWQGEGLHTGKSAFFVRLHGCPVQCPWCDSAGTWHPEYKPKNIDRLEPGQLAEEAFASGCELVVITGGEPAIHNLNFLVQELQIRNLPIHLETCGAYPIQGEMDWITLSPKTLATPLEENLKLADEFKIIIENENSMQEWASMIDFEKYGIPTWLHPEWSVARNNLVLESITTWVKKNGSPYRAGFQLHKLFHADEKDKRTRPIASLSENPSPF